LYSYSVRVIIVVVAGAVVDDVIDVDADDVN